VIDQLSGGLVFRLIGMVSERRTGLSEIDIVLQFFLMRNHNQAIRFPGESLEPLGHDCVTPHGLNGGFLGLGLLALHDEQIQWIRLCDT
jgi:hypothetical protein